MRVTWRITENAPPEQVFDAHDVETAIIAVPTRQHDGESTSALICLHGSPENRLRMLIQVIRAYRAEMGLTEDGAHTLVDKAYDMPESGKKIWA